MMGNVWQVLLLAFLVFPRSSFAALAENCREIELNGAAGFGSQDKVVIRIVDAENASLSISDSCEFTVKANETAVDLLRRIPGGWGNGNGGTAGDNASCQEVCTGPETSPQLNNNCSTDSFCDDVGGDGVCGDRPKKVCGNTALSGRSCSIEARITQAKGKCTGANVGKGCKTNADCGVGGTCPVLSSDGSIRACEDVNTEDGETCLKKPAVLRVCCREEPLCKGKKLDEALPGIVPITIQTKVQPVPPLPMNSECLEPSIFCPTALPDDSVEPRQIALDPIGGRSGPFLAQRECRAALQTDVGRLTQTTVSALAECHRRVMAGEIAAGSCNAVNATSDPSGLVAAAIAALQETVNTDCAAAGNSPSDFGYRTCAPPCDAIVVGACVAGISGPCARDHECDTAPGAGDGVCGDWNTFASCAACEGAGAGVIAIERLYGTVGSGARAVLSPAAQACQNAIGSGFASLLAVDLRDVAKCQRDVDEFKVLLSARTPKCKDADRKGKRAKARLAIAAEIGAVCNNAALGQLDSCAGNLAGLRDCIQRLAYRSTAAVIDAAAPEGRCGDGKKGFGEKCDDGNTDDGDGCDSNCTLTACGNGVVFAPEQCDDGNTVGGDGCDATCVSEVQTCTPQQCSEYTFDCSGLFPGDCVCMRAAEGGGQCANNFNCALAATCNTTAECAPGERCYMDTCCGLPGTGRCGPSTCTAQ